MFTVPTYKSPVSLIPSGCLQFLDFAVDLNSLARVNRSFYEEIPSSNQTNGRHSRILRCLRETENGYVDMASNRPCEFGYTEDGRNCLEPWMNQWIPLPYLRLRDQKWPDGGERFECGPGNWSRAYLCRDEFNPNALRLVIAFDMTVESPSVENPAEKKPIEEEDKEAYFALAPTDVAAHATFRLATHVRDNAWFLNSKWVDDWLFTLWEKNVKKPNEERQLEYLASYLTFLEILTQITKDITVQVLNPDRDLPVDVDLILDIGNSRTSGILVETLPQRITNLNDSYLLQLRDITKPSQVYVDPFATRVEFSEATFGYDSLSRRSGRRTPAFTWPSAVRIGPEAARLSTLAVCAEGATGLSSPKRYLWDERTWQQSWRCNTGGGPEPMATHGLLAKRLNSQGTPLVCFDDALFRQNPTLRKQNREIAFEAHYTRSSLMLFLLVEIVLQALVTINSPGQRARRELPNVPRRLRRIIFTVPAGMPIAEQRIYRRWVKWAVRALWDSLGWQDFYVENPKQRSKPDYRLSPGVRCDWDEATCTQLVYLYNELTRKFQGDAHHLFSLMGTRRPAYESRPTIRMATIDIGGGTTDLSITSFVLQSEESDTARISPRPEFRDGFNLAGDDIVREIVNRHLLPAIGEAAVKHGVPDARAFLAQLFGRDVMDNSQENRNRRAQFARQLATPVALALLATYEQADLLCGTGAFTCTLGDIFRPHEAGLFPFPAYSRPAEKVLSYVEQEVARHAPLSNFSLLDVEIRIDPRHLDHTVREALARPLADLCEMVKLYDCDILLLTGRPSRWSGVIASIFAKLPVPADRILPMSEFRVGNWYPFADALGNITDPKTTVVVGAILCALAEGHLEGFSFDTSRLKLRSTARFIGEMDINGQIKQPKVWFEVDVNSPKEQEMTRMVMFGGPIAVGFRQLNAERWTTTRFHIVDFSTEEARRNAAGKLPYRLSMRLAVAEIDAEATGPQKEHDEGELFIDEILASDGSTVPTRDVEVRLQTLSIDEGYWLDTGIIYQSI